MGNHHDGVLSIESRELIPLVRQALDGGGQFKLLVTGESMFPFLKHMRDSVILVHPSTRYQKRGAIVLIERETKQLVLHRIHKTKSDGFVMNGDAQIWTEFVTYSQVIAVVSKIERNNRLISCDNRLYRFLSGIWMLLRPFRGVLFKCAGLWLRIYRKVLKIQK